MKIDWFRAGLILLGGAALIYVLIMLGDSKIAWLIP